MGHFMIAREQQSRGPDLAQYPLRKGNFCRDRDIFETRLS
jgi:hypothetical protein